MVNGLSSSVLPLLSGHQKHGPEVEYHHWSFSRSCSGHRNITLTGQLADSVWLTTVFAHVGVHEVHHVRADGGSEHGWQHNIFARGLSFLGEDRN